MEHLNKAQIVLLTLFASFVASMATGVVVVTLMQQSPEPVTQTITNVVEKTIEKVTPTFIEKPGKTVVVKDEDLVVAAIERNAQSTVVLRFVNPEGERTHMGIGTVVSQDGLIITNKHSFDSGLLSTSVNGISYTVEVVKTAKDSDLVLGRLVPVGPVATSTPALSLTPVTLGGVDTLKVGQTALTLGGRDGKTVASGLITNLDKQTIVDKETKAETTTMQGIGLSQRLSGVSNGAPIITLSGEVVGFVGIDESIGSQIGVPSSFARELIALAQSPAAPAKK